MPIYYTEKKVISAYYSLQAFINKHGSVRINLDELIRNSVQTGDVTEAIHNLIYRVSQLLHAECQYSAANSLRVRKLGKLRLNQAVFFPAPAEFQYANYSITEVNHHITGNGVIRRMS